MRFALALLALLALAFVACSDDDTGNGADTGPPAVEGTSYRTASGVTIIEFATADKDPSAVGDSVAVQAAE